VGAGRGPVWRRYPDCSARAHDDKQTFSGLVNMAAVSDIAPALSSACHVARMYHDTQTHTDPDELQTMGGLADLAAPYHIVNPDKIHSRRAVVLCTDCLRQATAAVTDVSDPMLAAVAYQTHVATAKLHYATVAPDMRTPKLKADYESACNRVVQDYSETFPDICRQTALRFHQTPLAKEVATTK
jgi:hypothetical protein